MDKRVFKVRNKDGQEVELYIRDPGLKDREEAESIRIKTWNRALKDGAILAEKLNKVLEEQGIWNQEKENKLLELRLELAEILKKLERGGIKLSEAKNLAIQARKLRNEINAISFERIRYINETCEGQSQNAEYNYLVSKIVVYNNDRNKPYFKDYIDFLNRQNDIDTFIISSKCADVLYGNTESEWVENKFLRKYKFVDENLRFINKDGHLIDSEGRLIDEDGNYVKYDNNGNKIIVDINGNPIESEQVLPFLDEDGKPILDT